MPNRSLAHVRHWVFDLDNTLYPPEARLFDQIEVRMTEFVMQALGVTHREADRLRRHYWQKYGTTLAGLMREHGVDPAPYLADVHEISLEHLAPDPGLAKVIAALPGRKIVHTNGSAAHAERVLAARGLAHVFDACFGIEHADFHPKPEARAFEVVFVRGRVEPSRAAMFEDDARNLEAPHAMGLRCIHVAPRPARSPHVHHHTADLRAFLEKLVR